MRNKRGETYVQRLLGIIFGVLGVVLIVAAVVIHLAFYGGFHFSPFMWSNGSFIVSFALFQTGLPLFLLGLVFFLWAVSRKRKIRRLIAEGDRITADIDDIVPNMTVHAGRRFPYNILCSWSDTRSGVTYHFRSGNIWHNPARMLEERGIKTVTVYTDRANIRKYYVAVPGFDDNDIWL